VTSAVEAPGSCWYPFISSLEVAMVCRSPFRG
jgi:hypothetical protein